MSIDHVSDVLRLGPEVSGSRRLVLIVLAEMADGDSGVCFPKLSTIGERAGIARTRTVSEVLSWLESHSLIERKVNGWAGFEGQIPKGKRPNLYRLTLTNFDPAGVSETDGMGCRIPTGVGCRIPTSHGVSETDYQNHHEEPSIEPVCDPAAPNRVDTAVDVPRAPTVFEAEAETIAVVFADYLTANPPGSKRPKVSKAWLLELERMLRIDGRDPEVVRRCLRWIFEGGGSFWIANCRSPKSLRDKFDTLVAQSLRDKQRLAGGPDSAGAQGILLANLLAERRTQR